MIDGLELYIQQLVKSNPILEKVILKEQLLWKNPDYNDQPIFPVNGIEEGIMDEAKARFKRFKPVLKAIFAELSCLNGEIVSPLVEVPIMKSELERHYELNIKGTVLIKRDDILPVAGSIKARGGFHEVLAFAELLALENGIINSKSDDYLRFVTKEAKTLFSQYNITVGSTGNLGLSIGMIGSALGFQVTVHMSSDAKQWKKELLRNKGVKVVEHNSDYSVAVENARKESARNKKSYFVDDENSTVLFAGYSVAAAELKKQLEALGMNVNCKRPLYVYLPCGVGGGPGGITFGLKSVFGENVHCFFAEPTHSPCMLIGLITKLHHQISVQDFLLDNKTEADGLAVGRPSSIVGKVMQEILSGVYTINDEELLKLEYLLYKSENIFLEPSALAGMLGPVLLNSDSRFLDERSENAIHIVWATGGSLVPNEMRKHLLNKGRELIK